MIITYAVMAIVATLMLIGHFVLVRNKEHWLLCLFACVAIVNVGYFLLSISKTLGFAIFANDIVYLGSVFLSMFMLLSIIKLCGFQIKKQTIASLVIIGAVMFGIVATSGFLPWYYKEIELGFVAGAAKLKKVYGVLHPTYLIYLFVYFTAMVACIIQSVRKKMIASQRHAAVLAVIVFGNIAIWFVEKFIPWDFEFLSVSYLFSEIILLALSWMMQEYVRVDLVPQQPEEVHQQLPIDIATMPMQDKIFKILSSLGPGEMLASREREILELILQNKKRKEIAEELRLSENTIKTYTRTLYGKLGVKSRDELYALLIK